MPSLETSDTSSPAAEQFTIEASLPESINAVNTNGASRETIPIVSNHHTNGTTSNSANGHTNGRTNGNTNGHSNGGMDDHSPKNGNGVGRDTPSPVTSSSTATKPPVPIAICGMALRLPGGLETPQDLWDFLMAKGDARSRVPESRYNISAYHSDSGRPGTIATQYGYFLDDDVKLGSLDAARFSLSRAELEFADPQQRRMLEVVREAFDDAGVVDFKGRTIGCYMGSYGEDWLEMQNRDHQQSGVNRVDGYSDFMLSSRISYEMDLKGPCMTVRTACSAALICLNEACQAIQNGICDAAVVGGANLIMAPGMTAFMTEKGVLSPEGHCRTFSADANGYARGEAVTAVFVKPLDAAIRDGNPIRAVLRSVVSNSDGKTQGIAQPSTESQEALMRKAYRDAGITDLSKTAFVECHGTGTPVGDPIETNAVARVFGDAGVFIGSVKPNLGHSEGASGLTSLIKAVLSLENRTIPPNIKFTSGNPKIPFKDRKLTVPLEATPWPEERLERVSVNSFGIGGSNAHAILDSARSFGIEHQPVDTAEGLLENKTHLLPFSATSSSSLQKMTSKFQEWIRNNPDKLEELAYTLSLRREHLPHRSFMVASVEKLPEMASQGLRAGNASPNLVMVFTGQGAQWPRMGRELLLREDLAFQSSIRSLDKYLHEVPDAPEWTIEEELLKPARKSGVQRAELSQPLCTAVQIALVDLFASLGVKPYAVVGHSSGEIAAAYAAKALTAKEAIIVAWQRGLAAKEQTRVGAMAAVGLGREEAIKFLPAPKVVVACENSPRSVTISGDADAVQSALDRIQQAHPGITARLLKVEKAYHSYHMAEVGDFYTSALRKYLPGLVDQKSKSNGSTQSAAERSALFYSSVSGSGEPIQACDLDGNYWQKNLESPVLFNGAVSGIIKHIENAVFLEIGPHPALAGPVRQIMTAAADNGSTSASSYFGAMTRGENCAESFLTSVGRLFELNVPIDFSKITTKTTSLPGLPHYPWDHDASYWRESRISHEWRYREFPAHPLLGIRQLESTTLEPSFRNMLLLDDAPWLRDHCIEDNVIFPCAGYVSMIGEGIRQISPRQQDQAPGDNGFTIRNMVLNSALVLNENTPAELVTTFRPVRLTDSLNSQWWTWTISSHNGHVWTKHCSGEATSEDLEPEKAPETVQLPRKVDRRKYYDVLSRAGIGYGPKFQRLDDIRTGSLQSLSAARLPKNPCGDEKFYHLHPAVIDACIQSGPVAATRGHIEAKHYRRVPTKIERVTVHRIDPEVDMRASASAVFVKGSGEVISHIQCIADGKVVLDMQGAKLSPLEEAATAETAVGTASVEDGEDINAVAAPKALTEELTTSRLTWSPHIDFLDANKLIKPEVPRHLYTPLLDKMVRMCFVYSQRRIKSIRDDNLIQDTLPEHMHKYMSWIDSQVAREADDTLTSLDDTALLQRIDSLIKQMEGTPVEDCASSIEKVLRNIDGLCTGTTDALEMLLADGTLTKIYVATDACDRSDFIRHLAHSKPNLRILEIGAGTGASTASMLKHLILPVGQPLYSKYTFTDISAGFFVAAKERFTGYRNIEYRVLDISKSPSEQGFADDEKYDLVIATNVLHATKSLQETLRHVHKLLDPRDGRLLLHELDSPSKWPNYIFGTLPGWWYGAPDGRPEQPYVSPARWEKELEEAGFDGLDAVIRDAEEPHQLNAIMVARVRPRSTKAEKPIVLLCDDGEHLAEAISLQLEQKGYTVNRLRLGDKLPDEPQDVVSLLDATHPFFEGISEDRFRAFQGLLKELSSSGAGMLWVTHLSQVGCKDPRFAQIIGTARTIRTESLLDLATCEVDDLQGSLTTVLEVLDRFQARPRVVDESEEGDALDLKPDYEYAIVDGVVKVGRIYPFSLKSELSEPASERKVGFSDDSRVSLSMTKPGRLTTLHWANNSGNDEQTLEGDDVEVQIFAAGLNFKDVLGALGVVPYPEAGLGLEGGGVVRRVGPQVKDLQPGDRIMFLADGAFSSHVVTPERLCEKIPADLSFEDAATMPAVFATAVCSLFNIGGLRKGQSVLIHSAAGGVGLAAMQLATMAGAEIYATVGNEDKAMYLVDAFGLPRNRVFNSRDASFVDGLMKETNGRGVDLALNSLSGELLHATWRCVAEFGKLVEIGKRDFLGGGKLDMDVFLGSRSYCCFYLDAEMARRQSLVKELLQTILLHLRMGHIKPLTPKKVFDASSVQDGFRHLQQGTHIGKIVFSVRSPDGNLNIDTGKLVKPLQTLKLSDSANYLLVGGLGGLGRAVARHLVEQGARRLVFMSRSAGSGPEDGDTVRELESMGCQVELVRGSVINKDDVSRAITHAPNLKGIIQASMVLRDENLVRMSLDHWNQAVAPKVTGTWNLHHAAIEAGVNLDFFVLFSSMSGVTGQAGQANYAGANTFLDTFVQFRTGLGLACSALDIGAVQDVGYVSQDEALLKRMKAVSAHGITEPELMEALTAAILIPQSSASAKSDGERYIDKHTIGLGLSTNVPLNSKESRAFWRKDRRMAVYHNNASKSAAETAGTSGSDGLKSFLARAKSDTSVLKTEESTSLLAREIGRKLFGFLLRSDEDLNTTVPLSQLGMDSLVGVEMRSWWRQAFGFDISVLELLVPASLLFADSPSHPEGYDDDTAGDGLYIDRILGCGPQSAILFDEFTVIKAPDDRVQSSTVSFFSNDRLIFLAGRLGTNILQELVENLDDLIKKRVCQKQTSRWDGIDFEKPDPVLLQPQMATSFLLAFFEHLHPVYPFLDRDDFMLQASDIYVDDILQLNPAFSALYHTILALGISFKLLADDDIGCVMPLAPESVFGNYDWFTSAIRLARISSIAYSSLFSISASLKSKAAIATAIARVRRLLEDWRMSIPLAFRPGEAVEQHDFDLIPSLKTVLLHTNYAYYSVVLSLERLSIHISREEEADRDRSKVTLMNAARSIVGLMVFIDFEPHVPIFISGTMPLSALFVLFDFVIHNPHHARTEESIALLDAASRYFGVIDSASKGALPGGIISEFAGIAGRYVSSVQRETIESGIDSLESTPSSATAAASGDYTTTASDSVGTASLSYSTPSTQKAGVQMGELKTLFGWVFPDWNDDM
ncbi:polyketide synthase [Colletotrichum camelliae]|nr:polyketide synthase [Colletotrichum camelliae]